MYVETCVSKSNHEDKKYKTKPPILPLSKISGGYFGGGFSQASPTLICLRSDEKCFKNSSAGITRKYLKL